VIEAQYQRLLSFATTSGADGLEAVGDRLPVATKVLTQIGIDYRALVEPKVFIGATTFVFLRRAVAFGKR
jgi:hypothetical protein